MAELRRGDHHACKPGRQRQRPEPPSEVRDAAVGVERLQFCQLRARRVDGGGRRRIDPGQRAGIGCAPFRAVEQQARKIGGADLGLGERRQALRLPLVPQAIADAGPGSAGAAPPLIGGGTGHTHGLQSGDAHVRLETWNAREAAVDDHAHALDGDRCLGNRGRKHHLAKAVGRRLQRQVLRLHVHRAVEGSEHDRRVADALGQSLLDPPDLGLAGQERQDGAGFRPQRPHHRVRDLILDARAGIAAQIARLDREGAALAGDDGSIAQDLRHPCAVERRRHRQDAQVLPQAVLAVERQGKPQVGIERALVELVEQHRADTGKLGVIEDHAGEDALGDDLDARSGPRFRDHARAQSDPLADSLRQGVGHALGSGPRGDAARLQHQDLAPLEPAFLHQGKRDARRLAGAGRRDEHGRCARGQGGAQFVEDGVDRKRCGELHGGCIRASRPSRKRNLCRPSKVRRYVRQIIPRPLTALLRYFT